MQMIVLGWLKKTEPGTKHLTIHHCWLKSRLKIWWWLSETRLSPIFTKLMGLNFSIAHWLAYLGAFIWRWVIMAHACMHFYIFFHLCDVVFFTSDGWSVDSLPLMQEEGLLLRDRPSHSPQHALERRFDKSVEGKCGCSCELMGIPCFGR